MGASYLSHLPRGPFSYMTTARKGDHDGNGVVHVLDAQGRKVGVLWGTPDEKLALAELVIDARDRLDSGGPS